MGLNERAHHWALFFHKGTCWDGFPVGLNLEFAIPAIQEVSGAKGRFYVPFVWAVTKSRGSGHHQWKPLDPLEQPGHLLSRFES